MNNLRPNSVCDTTPLQRFESQSSGSEPSSPAINERSVENESSTLSNSGSSSAGGGGGGGDALAGVTIIGRNSDTLPAIVTNHNNNKIDIGLGNFGHNASVTARKMEYERGTRQIFTRIFCDLCILACVLLPIYGMQLWVSPHERGFFCTDETIKFPFQKSTLKSWHMTLMCIAVPISLITLIEFYRAHDNDIRHFEVSDNDHYYFCHLPVPNWLITCYKKIGYMIFGAGVAKLTTDIAKYSIGRLRPYFYTVCKPVMPDGTTCSDLINIDRYIEHYSCQGPDATAKALKEMRLSFPSGHTNFAFFAMIYTVIYLQKRMTWEGSKMLKHLLQFLLLMFAWYTALTRVSDYRHHYTDVLAGAAIGTTYAVIVTSSMW